MRFVFTSRCVPVVTLLLMTVLAAGGVVAQMLNSERIAATFGNFGIDVLYSDRDLRLSNLYSEAGGQRTTRTLASVRYPASVDPLLADLHAAIVDGGSIGATFQAAGWTVTKHAHSYRVVAHPRLDRLMQLEGVAAIRWCTSRPPRATPTSTTSMSCRTTVGSCSCPATTIRRSSAASAMPSGRRPLYPDDPVNPV